VPTVAIDAAGNAFVTALRSTASENQVVVRRWSSTMQTWEPEEPLVTTDSAVSLSGSVVMGSGGNAMLLWVEQAANGDRSVHARVYE